MGFKLAAVMAMLMVAMGGAFSWYYNDTQERIGVLRENNAKLETAVEISENSLQTLQEDVVRLNQANKQLQADLQAAEAYGDELQSKLRKLDLVQDALKDPERLEGKMNGATAKLWRGITEDTGGDGSDPLPNWLQSGEQTGAGGESGNSDRENTDTNGAETEASTAD